VEICDGGVVVLGEGDEFMACAFDDSEGDEFVGHWLSISILVTLGCIEADFWMECVQYCKDCGR
jgi:hypothetical protein